MKKKAFAVIRFSKEKQEEVFLINEISIDPFSAWEKAQKSTDAFSQAYPLVRVAPVLITVLEEDHG